MKKISKTNVCRILDGQKIEYEFIVREENQSFEDVGEDRSIVFKTLVLVGNDKNNYVCIIPVDEHLDLKKAARAFGIKNIQMILQKDLKNLTGYVHGGCSPIGMKTKLSTVIDKRALDYDRIIVSAGKVLNFIKIKSADLSNIVDAQFFDLVV